ncbi:MAG: tetratricopeptide repeat protein [Acidobacteriota bacterium]|nr:tetratricopeptide repeat protein [Acidobacteriota bacterium]MDQ7087297.1 tetratricopeptide repeat protein [Acidobacteriota bacterium]
MRIRTFIAVILLLSFAAGIVFILLPNREILELRVDLAGHHVPVWGALLGAFAAGSLISLAFQITGWGRTAYTRARSLWSTRGREAAGRSVETGRQAEREGRLEDAIAAYQQAIERSPGDFRSLMRLGDALRRAGRSAEAVGIHERARRIEPDSDEPGHALALDYLESGRLEDARRELTSLVKKNPRGAIGPLRQLRDLEIRAGEWEAAADAARRLATACSRSGAVPLDRLQDLGLRTQIALRRLEAGEARAAAGLLRKLLRKEGEYIPARITLAQALARAGDAPAAREALLEGFRATGEPALLDALAALDLDRGHPEEAISSLRGLIAAQHFPAAARWALGKLYLRLEMHDEAVDQFELILEEVEDHPLVLFHLAQAEERRDNASRAAELYRHVLETQGPAEAYCSACGWHLEEWSERCPGCGHFGTVATALSPAIAETGAALARQPT